MPDLCSILLSWWQGLCLSCSLLRWFVPSAVALSITIHCKDSLIESIALYGFLPSLKDSSEAYATFQQQIPGVPPLGFFAASPFNQIPLFKMQVPVVKRLIYNSAKLTSLNAFLQELKVVSMVDLIEEYLVYCQHKYLQLMFSQQRENLRKTAKMR
ncbi:hypothetical protein BT96DRAFT_957900 [Gymnopus androsaceus JB14]|uniref:Uncharacterized protein n=1 Tax=Gymnopus androsaceus JB14 TaxID=1447944 RepID=A0A6A4HHW5_9AGAR|nr:hypothetical protein BT96DRAFT_957900 [Gymnopus androsaceus JB14]